MKKNKISQWLQILAIRKDERWSALSVAIILSALNILFIINHFQRFTQAKWGHIGAWTLFSNRLHLSGFDPYTYMSMTDYTTFYAVNRHPLITIFLYPFYLLNHWIITTFNFNAAMFIMAFWVVLAGIYAFIFQVRTMHEVMGLERKDSIWLSVFLFSFASIMTAAISPDLFIFSFALLSIALYAFGRALKENRYVDSFKTNLLFFLTTGITLTNGAKILLGDLWTRGKHFFNIHHILIVFVIPMVIISSTAYVEYIKMEIPREARGQQIAKKQGKTGKKQAERNKAVERIDGKAITDIPFLRLINVNASRPDGIIEGLFGESIILHRDHLLGDIFLDRPVVVHYRAWWPYAINGIIVLLFIAGVVAGRKRKIIQMLLTWFAIDFLIHVVLGFGLNEVNINGAHWMFIIPIAISCLYSKVSGKSLLMLRTIIACLTIFLCCYNGALIVTYFWP